MINNTSSDEAHYDDLGELNEYVGCKIDSDEYSVRFTQPYVLQSYED
jgi:hypothetical protein